MLKAASSLELSCTTCFCSVPESSISLDASFLKMNTLDCAHFLVIFLKFCQYFIFNELFISLGIRKGSCCDRVLTHHLNSKQTTLIFFICTRGEKIALCILGQATLTPASFLQLLLFPSNMAVTGGLPRDDMPAVAKKVNSVSVTTLQTFPLYLCD